MYVVPMTLLLLSSSTTAPLRRPGAAGVNVTLTVQVWFCRRLAPLHVPPPALAKSSPEIPRVSTSTVDTDSLPESVSITITDCALVAWPTGWGVVAGAKSMGVCAWALRAPQSSSVPVEARVKKSRWKWHAAPRRQARRQKRADSEYIGGIRWGLDAGMHSPAVDAEAT